MKIKQISCDTVSVYLTREDLELFDISPETIGPQSGELNRFLFMIMETVKFETEFDPYNGQVVVEARTMPEGLHLIISKLGARIHKLTREEFKRARSVSVIKNLTPMEVEAAVLGNSGEKRHRKRKSVFIFDSFKELEDGIGRIDDEIMGKCELYRSEKRYALIGEISRTDRAYSILNEFSSLYKVSDILADDICEGWNAVAKGSELARMAAELRKMR